MKKIYTTIIVFLYSFGFAQQGSPASPYYDGFDFSQTGAALRQSLSDKIITTHTVLLTYQDAEDAIKIVDRDPTDLSNQTVLLVYGFSDNICPDNSSDYTDHRRRNRFDDGTGFCQWNREHTYPRSRGIPDLGSEGPGADVHHLRASDVNRNSDRGSLKFGPGSGNSGNFGGAWYPGDEWKGDIARMMMYMYLHYGNQCLPRNVGVGNLVSTDNNMVDLFLQWNAEDPVSEFEDKRNTYLGNTDNFFAQGNRNPFIDNPYLATLIWGGTPAENRWPALSTTTSVDLFSSVTVYPNPTQNNQVNITSDIPFDSIQLLNTNGQLVQEYKNPAAINQSYTLENLPQGFYFIKLNTKSQTTTRKVIVN
jgi:endonuclease I